MVRRISRLLVASAVAAAVVLGGVAVPVAAQEACADGCLKDPGNNPPEVITPEPDEHAPDTAFTGPSGTGKTMIDGGGEAFATRVRKAFAPGTDELPAEARLLKAKKAFHEARQEIQSIKKGEEDPTEDVPTFFDDGGDTDGDG